MKKLFTLLTLALFAVSGAWATEETVSLTSYTVTDNKATITNGDVTVVLSRTSGTLPSAATSSRGIRWQSKCVITASVPSGNIIKSVKLTSGKNGNSVGSITFTLTDGESTISGTWDNALNGNKQNNYTWTAGNSTETNNWVLTNTGTTGDLYISAVTVTYQVNKTISTQTFAGVKKGEATLTENTDYTLSGTTITLADTYKATTAPTDITLTNHIVYTDETSDDVDVPVSLSKNSSFFEGTATIGATEYTVKVPYDATETLEADKASLSVVSTKAAIGTTTIKLTGANLTGETSVAFASAVENLTISPATITLTDGAVDQTFTVSYFSMDAVAETTVNLTFTVGSKSVVVPVTYSSTAADVTTITDVTEATTWEWKKDGVTSDVSSTANGYEIPFANVSGFPASDFNYQALAGNGQLFYRKDGYFQGTSLKFHTTEAGYITVVFSNTGTKRPYRYLYLNGSKISDKARSASGDKVTVENVWVEAGDVELSGYIENASDPQEGNGDVVGPQMLRIYKIIFVPSEFINVIPGETGWMTFVSDKNISYSNYSSNLSAYIITGHEGDAIQKTKIEDIIPANTPVLLQFNTIGVYSLSVRASSSNTAEGNLLKAGTGAAVSAESGKTKYVLSVADDKAVFKKINATAATIPADKAYLEFDEVIEAPLFDLDGEATGIKAVENSNVENQKFYNLAGQQVAQPTKGLYIVNGKKVIMK